ncbi:hypothetical protein ACQJBY_054116 [Aegilops geniculata]
MVQQARRAVGAAGSAGSGRGGKARGADWGRCAHEERRRPRLPPIPRPYCQYIPSGMEYPDLSRKLRPSGGSFAMRVSMLTILHFHFQGVLLLGTHPPVHIFA